MTTFQWSPASVLQLDPHSTCIGYARTQGRRCRNPIAYANRQEAAKILLQMSRLDPQSPRMDSKVEDLASRLLCRRWHQDQAFDLKEQWLGDIEDYLAAERMQQAQRLRAALMTAILARSGVAPTRATSPRRERAVTSRTAPLVRTSVVTLTVSMTVRDELGGREDVELIVEINGEQTHPEPSSLTQQRTSSRNTTTDESNESPQSSANEPTTPTSTAPSQEPSTATRVEAAEGGEGEGGEGEGEQVQQQPSEQQQQIAPIPSPEAQTSHPTTDPSIPIPQSPPVDSHPTPHDHNRRAVEGDCSICFEDLTNGHDTTWCRAQCRHNFHAGCLSLWHALQVASERVKTCPFCRTEWAE